MRREKMDYWKLDVARGFDGTVTQKTASKVQIVFPKKRKSLVVGPMGI
jgi:hypothetical protein